ncbi:MAG: hypothetical protein JXA45_06105 [Methanomassiliicoccales archaeon]|nr:hypothetical protein [Methanomassiliicoccales archaeon]
MESQRTIRDTMGLDDDEMLQYEIVIDWAGNAHKETIECENNEESKRAVKRKMRDLSIPQGKYVFINIVRLDNGKVIVEDELWSL